MIAFLVGTTLIATAQSDEISEVQQLFVKTFLETPAHKPYSHFLRHPAVLIPELGVQERAAKVVFEAFDKGLQTGAKSFLSAKTKEDKIECYRNFTKEFRKTFENEISDRQRKRLLEITFWTGGPGCLADPAFGLLEDLKLSSGTAEKVKAIQQEFLKQVNDAHDPRDMEIDASGKVTSGSLKKLEDRGNVLYEKFDRQVLELLSSSQREFWTKIRGKKMILWSEVK